jgi:CBS domain containing-hemolysin-like protein
MRIAALSALGLLFLAMSAFFSASETAIFSIPGERVENFKTSAARNMRLIRELLLDGRRTLLLLLLANLFVNITLAGIINSLITATVGKTETLWSFAAATALIVAFGEVLPKNAALKKNETVAAFAAPILSYMMKALSPLLGAAMKINGFLLARVAPRFRGDDPFITIDELKTAVHGSFAQGVISKSEEGVITNLLDRGALPAKRLMTHRTRLPLLPHYATATEALAEITARNMDFALIADGQRNPQITGVVTLHDLMKAPPGQRCRRLATPPRWAPETTAAADLVSFMFAEGLQSVCLVDESGDLSGALSLRDGAEKLISENPRRAPQGKGGNGNARLFNGLQEIDAMTGWLPECLAEQAKDARTLNGLLTRRLGRIPKTGERLDIGGTAFYIMYSGDTKIESVLIRKT